MSPRRDARRLEQVLPARVASTANSQPLRVIAMPVATASEASVSKVSKATPHERASAQIILRWADALAYRARQAVQAATPMARQAWGWLRTETESRLQHSKTRRLRLAETLSLGEKRFVSLVEVDGQAFLIGGSSSGISLLAECQGRRAEASFGSVMEQARWPEKESA